MTRFIIPLVLVSLPVAAQTPPPPPVPNIVCEYDARLDAKVCREVTPVVKK